MGSSRFHVRLSISIFTVLVSVCRSVIDYRDGEEYVKRVLRGENVDMFDKNYLMFTAPFKFRLGEPKQAPQEKLGDMKKIILSFPLSIGKQGRTRYATEHNKDYTNTKIHQGTKYAPFRKSSTQYRPYDHTTKSCPTLVISSQKSEEDEMKTTLSSVSTSYKTEPTDEASEITTEPSSSSSTGLASTSDLKPIVSLIPESTTSSASESTNTPTEIMSSRPATEDSESTLITETSVKASHRADCPPTDFNGRLPLRPEGFYDTGDPRSLSLGAPCGAKHFGSGPFGSRLFGSGPFVHDSDSFGSRPFGPGPFGAGQFGSAPFDAGNFGSGPSGHGLFGYGPSGPRQFGPGPFGSGPSDLRAPFGFPGPPPPMPFMPLGVAPPPPIPLFGPFVPDYEHQINFTGGPDFPPGAVIPLVPMKPK